MEPVSQRSKPWSARVLGAIVLVILVSGPANCARVISAISSLLTWPLTRHLRFAGNGYEVFNVEILLIYVIVVLALNLSVQAGLISLGHTTFLAIGAYVSAILTVDHHVSFWIAMPLATLLCGVVGFVLGLPSGRLGTFTFAMATLGYAIVSGDLALEWRSFTGGGDGLPGIVKPAPFDGPSGFYWALVITVLVIYVLCQRLLRSRFGRASVAVAEGELAAASLGISPWWIRTRSFAVSAAIAGLAGAFYGPLLGFVTPEGFTVSLATLFVLMVVLGGSGTLAGPILGAILLFRLPIEIDRVVAQPGDWTLVVSGGTLLVVAVLAPRGLMSVWWRIRTRLVKSPPAPRASRAPSSLADLRQIGEGDGSPVLEITGANKRFGTVQAISDVNLVVRHGTVHALIGPNGAGKTSVVNLISGYTTPDSGSVKLWGENLNGASPQARARKGLARTFQHPQIFAGMTAGENVMTALDQQRQGSRRDGIRHPVRTWRRDRVLARRAADILDSVGLTGAADQSAGSLSSGSRRLLELARVIAQQPTMILLDEPAGGLNEAEIVQLRAIVEALRDAGTSILLIEHHVDFVLRVADDVTVMNLGGVIFHGSPIDAVNDPLVVETYLGEVAVEERLEDLAESLDHASAVDRQPEQAR